MCVVSMIGDHYRDKLIRDYPQWVSIPINQPEITRAEFESLKKEILEMKELLKKAIAYDKQNNQPHCEKEEKIDLLRKVAKLVGIELDDVLHPQANSRS